MGVRLRVFLTRQQDRTLFELRTAQGVPQRTCIPSGSAAPLGSWLVCGEDCRLLELGRTNGAPDNSPLADLHVWRDYGMLQVVELSRRWQEADRRYLEQCLEQEPRTYNAQQLTQKLKSERQVQLSPDRIRRILKKRG